MDFLYATGETVDTLLEGDQWIIEGMLAAYCQRSKVDPMKVAAVETQLPNGSTAYWYGVLEFDENGEPVGVRQPTWWEETLEALYRMRGKSPLSWVVGGAVALLLFWKQWHSPTYRRTSGA